MSESVHVHDCIVKKRSMDSKNGPGWEFWVDGHQMVKDESPVVSGRTSDEAGPAMTFSWRRLVSSKLADP